MSSLQDLTKWMLSSTGYNLCSVHVRNLIMDGGVLYIFKIAITIAIENLIRINQGLIFLLSQPDRVFFRSIRI